MIPITPPEKTNVFTAPEGMGNCGDLETHIETGKITSLWQMTPEELEEVNRNGGKVFLSIHHAGQPPVSLTPFQTYGEEWNRFFIQGAGEANQGRSFDDNPHTNGVLVKGNPQAAYAWQEGWLSTQI